MFFFDKKSFDISKKLIGDIDSYIDEHYVDSHSYKNRSLNNNILSSICLNESSQLDDMIDNIEDSFSDKLFKLIDVKGKSDVEVYKKANIDRRLFSKIRYIKDYTPKKSTILALSISLELTLEETDDLLERAGYAFSHASKFDIIIEYFIINNKYDIYEINEVLFEYDQPLLGG